MKKSVKAALLSGLVFPGAGQMIIKRRARGALLIITSLVCLGIVVRSILIAASAAAEKIMAGGDSMDMAGIHEAAQGAVRSAGGIGSNVALIILIGCWVYGIFDACCIGKAVTDGGAPQHSEIP